MTTNDREYWDGRFGEDWQAHGGPDQTRFFTQIALEAMPDWFLDRVRGAGLSLCDWGCAEGEGAAMLARELGAPVVGVDFAEIAIATARGKFPDVEFRAIDWLAGDGDGQQFDVLFSSNTLEHFHAPWEVFDSIVRHASRYVVLLVPYREEQRHPEHFAGFDPASVPASRGGWALAHAAVIDARDYDDTQWEGEQILAIYARPAELEAAGVTLEHLRIDTPVLEALRDELVTSRVLLPSAAGSARALPKAVRGLQVQMGEMQSQLVAAISNDIVRMQGEHARMLASSGVLQSDLAVAQNELAAAKRELAATQEQLAARRTGQADERAERAEQFSRWAAQAWGDATEQRQAVEALTEAVIGMESRLVSAIGEDIRRMQEPHAELLVSAGRLEGKPSAKRTALLEARCTIDSLQQSNGELEKRCAELESLLANAEVLHSRQDGELVELRKSAEQLAVVHRSASWRVTRALHFARRLVRHGLGQEERTRLAHWVTRSRWVPLPMKARLALSRRLRPEMGQMLGPLPASSDGSAALPELAPLDDVPDVFIWAVIDWHFRTQRPQHLARALAEKGHRVFYVSNVFVDAPEPGFAVEDLAGAGRLFQVRLNVPGAPSIYASLPDDATLDRLASSLSALLTWTGTRRSVSIVQHPYWASPAQFVPNARLVYDCMDHHAGFEDNTAEALAHEQALARRADLVVTTSTWLEDAMAPLCHQVALVRNGTDFDHFRDPPVEVYRDPEGRRIIGYIGAIAEWFDVDLVRRVAEDHGDCVVVLVGADTAGAASLLADVRNVRFIGEVRYARLPYWLHSFDVCLLPFRVIALTLATNPVKIYEYLSAAKPVVATDLPEMAQFGELVEVTSTPDAFAEAVTSALGPATSSTIDARRAFASCQTWGHRAQEFVAAIARIEEPKVSVVVLTYNNLDFTKACLFSVEAYSDYPNLEVIVVDNGSTDGTREYLQEWVTKGADRNVILNKDNRGFAAGNNQGLEAATGEYLVILNNDTYVTPGWIRTLAAHLRREPSLGIVGPITNKIGNEARITITYADMEEMIERAGRYTRAHPGRRLPLPTVAFFCAMLRRSVWERVGGLDERFGLGFFEDDDYCRRVGEAGMGVACAEDVFVHHHLSASFGVLKSEAREALFERNKALYEAKWGTWLPHVYLRRLPPLCSRNARRS